MCRVFKCGSFLFVLVGLLVPNACIGAPSGSPTLAWSCYQWMADQKASLTAPLPIAFWLDSMNAASNADIVFSETQVENDADIACRQTD